MEASDRVQPSRPLLPEGTFFLIGDVLCVLIGSVCVGTGRTRTEAKLANRTAKKLDVFDGVCVWPATRPEWREKLMRSLPVSEVWGTASRLERRLAGYGIETIWELATANPAQIRKWFNVVVMRTALELRGVACIGPEEDRTGKKDQLIVSRSFSEKVTTRDAMRQVLSIYAQQAAGRLVKHQQVAKLMQVFAGTSHWTEQKHYPSAMVRLPFPTADPVELTRAAHRLLPQIEDGTRYARAGIILTDLMPAGIHLPLEPFRQPHEDRGIAQLMADVQRKAGRDALGLGYAGVRVPVAPTPVPWTGHRSLPRLRAGACLTPAMERRRIRAETGPATTHPPRSGKSGLHTAAFSSVHLIRCSYRAKSPGDRRRGRFRSPGLQGRHSFIQGISAPLQTLIRREPSFLTRVERPPIDSCRPSASPGGKLYGWAELLAGTMRNAALVSLERHRCCRGLTPPALWAALRTTPVRSSRFDGASSESPGAP